MRACGTCPQDDLPKFVCKYYIHSYSLFAALTGEQQAVSLTCRVPPHFSWTRLRTPETHKWQSQRKCVGWAQARSVPHKLSVCTASSADRSWYFISLSTDRFLSGKQYKSLWSCNTSRRTRGASRQWATENNLIEWTDTEEGLSHFDKGKMRFGICLLEFPRIFIHAKHDILSCSVNWQLLLILLPSYKCLNKKSVLHLHHERRPFLRLLRSKLDLHLSLSTTAKGVLQVGRS